MRRLPSPTPRRLDSLSCRRRFRGTCPASALSLAGQRLRQSVLVSGIVYGSCRLKVVSRSCNLAAQQSRVSPLEFVSPPQGGIVHPCARVCIVTEGNEAYSGDAVGLLKLLCGQRSIEAVIAVGREGDELLIAVTLCGADLVEIDVIACFEASVHGVGLGGDCRRRRARDRLELTQVFDPEHRSTRHRRTCRGRPSDASEGASGGMVDSG